MSAAHLTTVRVDLVKANVYRPGCSCGWTGPACTGKNPTEARKSAVQLAWWHWAEAPLPARDPAP